MRYTLLFCFLLANACQSPQTETVLKPSLKIDPKTTGTIRGVVLFEGTPPEATKIPLASFAQCSNSRERDEDVLIREGRVQNAFVYLREGTEAYEIPPASAVGGGEVIIDQRACLYTPRVVGLQIGQTLVVKNSDPFLHNVHALPKLSRSFNVGMGKGSPEIRRAFEEPEVMVPIRCDVHPWMRAYVGVLAHSYFAVTGPDGAFELKNVPPGAYTLALWHERLGTQTHPVSLETRGTSELTVVFK